MVVLKRISSPSTRFDFKSCAQAGANRKMSSSKGKKLLLTPLIVDGNNTEAKELAQVKLNLRDNENKLPHYSGFLTVHEKFKSNLFFWFFPTTNNFDPVVLWLQGGPGNSSLFGLFCENGPVSIDKNLQPIPRPHSWTKKHSMLYIDSPVGSGYSYTENEKGYATTYEEIAKHLYNALIQFFTMFPEYQQSNFYIAAESIGGKPAVLLALKIHKENLFKPNIKINIKGVASFASYIDPDSIAESCGDYFYNMGLLDEEQRDYFHSQYERMAKLRDEGDNVEAIHVNHALIRGNGYDNHTYFGDATGFSSNLNVIESEFDESTLNYIYYLNSDIVRSAIHVGDTRFIHNGSIARKSLYPNGLVSEKGAAEELLNLGYSVMLTAGQFDIIVPFPAIKTLVEDLLIWNGKKEFNAKKRSVWKLSDGIKVAGYIKQHQNLVYAFIRNAGHISLLDQQEACLDLIMKFCRGCKF